MIFENIKLAMSSICANKMRSFLTMLGMIIGISSVIAIVSLGDTMRSVVAGEYEKVGSGLAYAYIMSPDDVYTESNLFTKEDADQLKEGMDGAVTYAGFRSSTRTDLKVGRKTETVYLSGLAENPTEMEDPKIIYGRMLNDKDILEKKKFVVLDSTTAFNIFGQENAVGKTVKSTINSQVEELLVIGVFQNTDSALMKLMSGGSFASAYVPESILLDENESQWSLYFCMAEDQNMTQLQSRIQSYIARMKNQDVENVVCYSAKEEMGTIDKMLGSLSAVVGAIAAISLVVGGIGIMNIMLVSVTERTREIGIRKALGAKTRDIMIQFLIEAAAISAAGGIIGTILGISVVAIGGMVVGVGVVVKPTVVLVAVAFSAMVGLGFGLYPARKAAKKDPVDALRYE
ncbi:ABC transporter permease [Anaerotignum sp.]|uniref:ABC transporter permease n=1 Tax=Anaerotignum sp. TaxID=2039241 RepID=UPI002714509C|nr:ABC transporter permease [Anaerotignum sp.]